MEWCFEESTLQRRYPSNLVGCLTGRLQRERERERDGERDEGWKIREGATNSMCYIKRIKMFIKT